MTEETGVQTTTESVASSAEETQSVETQGSTAEVTEANDAGTTEATATNPFSKDDLDWTGFESLTDDQKDTLVKSYSGWFKDKDSANAYLKATAEANKTNKEAQAKKVAELEAGWEKSLKTDAEFGKDYEGNKKKVLDYAAGHLSESDMAEFKKFGFDKSPVLNRMILGFVKEIEDAKIVGKGQPAATVMDKQPRDKWGNTMFDFTKKQQ